MIGHLTGRLHSVTIVITKKALGTWLVFRELTP